MPRILIDNATISSAFRALGLLSLKHKAVLDVEQAALGRLVEAMILGDKVVVPSTYIDKYQGARKSALALDCFEHVEVLEDEDTLCLQAAETIAPIWADAYDAGGERGTFTDYFQQANAFSQFTWEHSSSAFYLVFRSMGVSKRSPLIEAFFASKKDDAHGPGFRLLGSDGQAVDWDNLSTHAQRMVCVLAWLAHRYLWHQVYSAQHDLVYYPHPLREFFAFDFTARLKDQRVTGLEDESRSIAVLRSALTGYTARLSEVMTRLQNDAAVTGLDLPVFLPIVLSRVSSRDDFLSAVMDLRSDAKAQQLRRKLADIDAEAALGKPRGLLQLQDDVKNIGNAIIAESGLELRHAKMSAPLRMGGVGVSGEDMSLKLPLPPWLYKQAFLHRRYRVFLRDVMSEIAHVATLGTLKDTLDSFVWWDEGSDYPPFYLKEPRFGKYQRQLTSHRPPKSPDKA